MRSERDEIIRNLSPKELVQYVADGGTWRTAADARVALANADMAGDVTATVVAGRVVFAVSDLHEQTLGATCRGRKAVG